MWILSQLKKMTPWVAGRCQTSSKKIVLSEFVPIFFYFLVFGCSRAYRILVHWPGIKPGPWALGVWSLDHWTPRKSLSLCSLPGKKWNTALLPAMRKLGLRADSVGILCAIFRSKSLVRDKNPSHTLFLETFCLKTSVTWGEGVRKPAFKKTPQCLVRCVP